MGPARWIALRRQNAPAALLIALEWIWYFDTIAHHAHARTRARAGRWARERGHA